MWTYITGFGGDVAWQVGQATALQIDYVGATREAVQTISDPWVFFLVILAVLLGLFMGMIPGLGGVVALSLVIPLTFGMEPIVAFAVLSAITGGTNFGGSVTSILINTPGKAGNAATLLDGYPMSRDGRAEEAIGASATASGLGSFFGVAVVIISIPIMMAILSLFGPPEVFWLALWGLTVVSVIVKGDMLAGLVSAAFGVLFSMHGIVQLSGTVRWDYGFLFMRDGMQFIPALIGLFAVSEMIKLVTEGGTIASGEEDIGSDQGGEKKGTRWDGVRSVFEHKGIFFRSAIIGGVIGIVPGIGSSAANFIAYFHAVEASPDSEVYGTGDVRGVIAPEASNDAKDGTSFLPTLAFGIPGSSSMAVLLGAFILHGITPGPQLFQDELSIIATIIIAFVISNLLTSVIGLVGAGQFYRITTLDTRLLAPAVLAIAFFGAYALDNSIYSAFIMAFFGILGFLMIKMSVSRIPMILGMVLGPLVEDNFFRSLAISQGDWGIFIDSYVSMFLIVLVVGSLGIPWIKRGVNKLQGNVVDEESVTLDEDIQNEIAEEQEEQESLWPGDHTWYRIGFFSLLFVWAAYLFVEVFSYDDFADWFFPIVILPAVFLLLILQLLKLVRPGIWDRFVPESSAGELTTMLGGASSSERTLYERQKVELYMIGWVLLLIGGSYFLGMGLTLPLFLFGFTYFFTHDLKRSLFLTVLISVFMYLLFIEILGMLIWTGVWDVFNPSEMF